MGKLLPEQRASLIKQVIKQQYPTQSEITRGTVAGTILFGMLAGSFSQILDVTRIVPIETISFVAHGLLQEQDRNALLLRIRGDFLKMDRERTIHHLREELALAFSDNEKRTTGRRPKIRI